MYLPALLQDQGDCIDTRHVLPGATEVGSPIAADAAFAALGVKFDRAGGSAASPAHVQVHVHTPLLGSQPQPAAEKLAVAGEHGVPPGWAEGLGEGAAQGVG